ncbi:MAG TPA: GntR family transcriptional regulator [Capsulimonadaceae bacterium]|jgi:DNA-binding LacI/PurR family transcriptional regulator/DNA-binding transcriptional regulator YhcF (GntR family)
MVTSEKTKKREYHPPYKRIESDLRHKIARGVWASGAMVPSRRELAEAYQVSLATIEHAMADLLVDGTLVSRDRRGTFVATGTAKSLAEIAPVPTLTYRQPEMLGTRLATIGIVSPIEVKVAENDWTRGWPYVAVNSVERHLTALGMRTRFPTQERHSLTDPIDVDAVVDELLAENVDGIVFVMLRDEAIEALSRRLVAARPDNPPVVTILNDERIMPGACVCYDNRDAGFHAAGHLIEQGCDSFVFVAPYESEFAAKRLAGIREALLVSGINESRLTTFIKPSPLETELEGYREFEQPGRGLHSHASYDWSREMLRGGLPGRGVIAVNDEVAIGFLQAAKEAGYALGRDFVIIGFDDVSHARPHNLSTMRPPLEEMGEEAARMMQAALSGRRGGQKVSLHSHLVARMSSHFELATGAG